MAEETLVDTFFFTRLTEWQAGVVLCM